MIIVILIKTFQGQLLTDGGDKSQVTGSKDMRSAEDRRQRVLTNILSSKTRQRKIREALGKKMNPKDCVVTVKRSLEFLGLQEAGENDPKEVTFLPSAD
ncbi:hypothetical protein DsansV1_C16g0141081 [Dioscorea sansibarensis]